MKKLLALLVATLATQVQAADTIKIALTGPFSGGSAPMGTSTRDGSKLTGYGATVRVYDPKLDAWRVSWNGITETKTFVARPVGSEIVMEEERNDGERARWIFSDVTALSFRWRYDSSTDGGATWSTVEEMALRRRK